MLMETDMAFLTDATRAAHIPSPAALFGAAVRIATVWNAVAKERRALRGMDAGRLDDLGLTNDAVRREASRPFWLTSRL